jgi:hypothetical protein
MSKPMAKKSKYVQPELRAPLPLLPEDEPVEDTSVQDFWSQLAQLPNASPLTLKYGGKA